MGNKMSTSLSESSCRCVGHPIGLLVALLPVEEDFAAISQHWHLSNAGAWGGAGMGVGVRVVGMGGGYGW